MEILVGVLVVIVIVVPWMRGASLIVGDWLERRWSK